MTRFKYYSNYLACLLGTLIAFELCWIGAKYVIEGEVVHTYLDHFIAVCDDIWHGGEDYRDWTEVYVRGLADICQGLAAEFDVVCEMTAGLPHLWKGELPRV